MGRTGNILARRKLWADTRSFVLGEYSRMLRKRRSWPLPARARAVWLRTAKLDGPIQARLGTSDFVVISDLLARGAADGRGEYDAAIDAAARHAGGAAQVRCVLDLGANIGLASVMLAKAFVNASVVAVEPDAANFDLLVTNTRGLARTPGGAEPVRCVRACVGATRRTVTLDRTAHGGEPWAIAMKETGAGDDPAERVETVTLPELAEGTGTIDLLKCDIEGAERELFEHCGAWIERVRVMVVELHAPYRRDEFLAHLARGAERAGSTAAPVKFAATMLKEDSAIQVLLLERQDASGGGAA